MTHFKSYIMAGLDCILLFIPWLEDLDQGIKTISLILGLVLAYYTIKKFRAEIKIKELEREKLEKEIDEMDE